MIRLRQTFGVHTGRSLEFDQPVVRVGRAADSDVLFHAEGDLDASGRHAELRQSGDAWELVDVGSRNGTFVNGVRVERALLKAGDEVEFGTGGPRLVVVSAGGDAAMQQAFVEAPTEFASSHPPPESPDKRYGAGTVRMMIRDAVEQARAEVLESQAQPSSPRGPLQRPVSLLFFAGGCLFLVAALLLAATFALVFLGQASGAEEGSSEAPESAGSAPESSASASDPAELSLALALLHSSEAPDQRCLAVAVQPRLLTTTASCALALHQSPQRREPLAAVQSGKSWLVSRVWRHPAYRDKTIESDASGMVANVAVLEVDRPLLRVMQIAPLDALEALREGSSALMLSQSRPGAWRRSEVTVDRTLALVGLAGDRQGLELQTECEPGAPMVSAEGKLLGLCAGGANVVRGDVIRAMIAGLASALDHQDG